MCPQLGPSTKGRSHGRSASEATIDARRKFLLEGLPPGAHVPAPIVRSWERSAAFGLNSGGKPGFDIVSQQFLAEAQQRNEQYVI